MDAHINFRITISNQSGVGSCLKFCFGFYMHCYPSFKSSYVDLIHMNGNISGSKSTTVPSVVSLAFGYQKLLSHQQLCIKPP